MAGKSKYPLVKPGDRFGRWEAVVEEFWKAAGNSGKKERVVECRCDCGNPEKRVVFVLNLYREISTSCGCCRKEKTDESAMKRRKYPLLEKGKVFGRLTVITNEFYRKDGGGYRKRFVECSCVCGSRQKEYLVTNLYRKLTISCGCYQKERAGEVNIIDKTEKRFGRLVTTELLDKRGEKGDTFYKCLCDCGNEVVVNGDNLARNHTQSCGCLNKFLVWKGREWEKMLSRFFPKIGYHTQFARGNRKFYPDFTLLPNPLVIADAKLSHSQASVQGSVDKYSVLGYKYIEIWYLFRPEICPPDTDKVHYLSFADLTKRLPEDKQGHFLYCCNELAKVGEKTRDGFDVLRLVETGNPYKKKRKKIGRSLF